MSHTEQQLREAFDRTWSAPAVLMVLPGPDEQRDPEGRVVVDGRDEGWSVYRFSRGIRDRRDFTTQQEAFDFAYRRWILRDADA